MLNILNNIALLKILFMTNVYCYYFYTTAIEVKTEKFVTEKYIRSEKIKTRVYDRPILIIN